MPTSKAIKTVALVGNPNAGKSSLFNLLTGLNQKIANFPGVTVDKKTGAATLPNGQKLTCIDLPGTYSLYPKAPDERVVFDTLINAGAEDKPDAILVVADASNLERNLLLYTQIADLGLPIMLVLNMVDIAAKAGIALDIPKLSALLDVNILTVNGRNGNGIDALKQAIADNKFSAPKRFYNARKANPDLIADIKAYFQTENDYLAFQLAHQYKALDSVTPDAKLYLQTLLAKHGFTGLNYQAAETIERYALIGNIIRQVQKKDPLAEESFSMKLDRVLTHKVWGFVIFFAVLLLLFQAIFSWAQYPMELIDAGFGALTTYLKQVLPAGALTDLLTDGVLAGLGGVIIFIPQIALLFAFIAFLEDSGYMARVMFIMDKLMRQFGLNGKSVVPLISGVACAVPAIMSARSIDNRRDRLITIFVTPLMSCSARIPVFTILIALMVPTSMTLWGTFSLQGLVLMALYLLGFFSAILTALLLKNLFKSKERSYFIMELPTYKLPRWKNIGLSIAEKVKAFVFEAGKIIIAISIVLWALASYGPGNNLANAETQVRKLSAEKQLSTSATDNAVAAAKLEASYAGRMGKLIEPAIKPLGFDWKIGVALLTSFAAREVFVGTMSTIYSLGSDASESEGTVVARMRAETNPDTGGPMYTTALACSLLVFYLFAMQCISTLAISYRETKSWIYPAGQLVYMSGLAWVCSFLVYSVLK